MKKKIMSAIALLPALLATFEYAKANDSAPDFSATLYKNQSLVITGSATVDKNTLEYYRADGVIKKYIAINVNEEQHSIKEDKLPNYESGDYFKFNNGSQKFQAELLYKDAISNLRLAKSVFTSGPWRGFDGQMHYYIYNNGKAQMPLYLSFSVNSPYGLLASSYDENLFLIWFQDTIFTNVYDETVVNVSLKSNGYKPFGAIRSNRSYSEMNGTAYIMVPPSYTQRISLEFKTYQTSRHKFLIADNTLSNLSDLEPVPAYLYKINNKTHTLETLKKARSFFDAGCGLTGWSTVDQTGNYYLLEKMIEQKGYGNLSGHLRVDVFRILYKDQSSCNNVLHSLGSNHRTKLSAFVSSGYGNSDLVYVNKDNYHIGDLANNSGDYLAGWETSWNGYINGPGKRYGGVAFSNCATLYDRNYDIDYYKYYAQYGNKGHIFFFYQPGGYMKIDIGADGVYHPTQDSEAVVNYMCSDDTKYDLILGTINTNTSPVSTDSRIYPKINLTYVDAYGREESLSFSYWV